MGKSGYTSLSLNEDRYAKLRKDWDHIVSGHDGWGSTREHSFTAWATTVLEQSIKRVSLIKSMYPNYTMVGQTDTGCVIKDKNVIVEVKWSKTKLVCSVDNGACKHCEFASMHPQF
jgi:hypothetical protein|tara:strand:+ start:172 stop:519 length:348 start_codon:yes stop_codon:yes gene_type:complete